MIIQYPIQHLLFCNGSFTSDHGNMLAEHGKMRKGRPYRTSAGIPFIVRYPAKERQGKIIKTSYSSIDFAPSILSLMDAVDEEIQFDGVDFSDELLSEDMVTNGDHISFTFLTGDRPAWAAAIMKQYKLVVSSVDIPYLFDLKEDPYEIINFFDSPTHKAPKKLLSNALIKALNEHDIPLKNQTNHFGRLGSPACCILGRAL